uniref:Uncharacterized protein n=1 Tax=viral metagenome TaxID=1070528 RepID=A0A6M3LMR5_9ZZZZ
MTHSTSACLKALAPQPAKAPLVCACGGRVTIIVRQRPMCARCFKALAVRTGAKP